MQPTHVTTARPVWVRPFVGAVFVVVGLINLTANSCWLRTGDIHRPNYGPDGLQLMRISLGGTRASDHSGAPPEKSMLHIKLSDDARVRIRSVPETEALGLAGFSGPVFGETKPSSSGVAVIGTAADDYAIAVHIEARDETLWFAPDLLEPVGPPPRPRGAWTVNEPPQRDETPLTRLLGWFEQFLPRLGKGRER